MEVDVEAICVGALHTWPLHPLNGVTRDPPPALKKKKRKRKKSSYAVSTHLRLDKSCAQSATKVQQSFTARAYARLTHSVTHEGLPQISLDGSV